jgi:hypothetical protein
MEVLHAGRKIQARSSSRLPAIDGYGTHMHADRALLGIKRPTPFKMQPRAINPGVYLLAWGLLIRAVVRRHDAPPGIRGESLAGFGQNLRSPHHLSAIHQEPRHRKKAVDFVLTIFVRGSCSSGGVRCLYEAWRRGSPNRSC